MEIVRRFPAQWGWSGALTALFLVTLLLPTVVFFGSPVDYAILHLVLEFASMKVGSFPEPLTFSLRLRRLLRERAADFDLVHDNQVLAYGMLALPRAGIPLVTSIHHPITILIGVPCTGYLRWFHSDRNRSVQ